MVDIEQDIIYCNDPNCKEQVKILASFAQIADKHNTHSFKRISVLRSELQLDAIDSNFLNQDQNDEKQDLITYIDDQVESLKKSFSLTIQKFSDQLKQFVNEILTSQKKIQMLFKAVMENNAEHIGLYQDHLEFLKKDNAYFKDQKEILVQVREQLDLTFKTTGDKIVELDKLNLLKPNSKPLIVEPSWSHINKHTQISVSGKTASRTFNAPNGSLAILLDPRLDFKQTQSIRLKIGECSYIMIQICDLKMIKSKCPDYGPNFQDGQGAYSHFNHGTIFGTDTYGQGITQSFTFAAGDILELQWNGPQKKFSTLKESTGEKFVFDVKFEISAEIYFGVSLYATDSVELI